MALTREDLALIDEHVKAIVSSILGQQPPPPIGEDCIAIDGSYDPTDGTISAKYGDTDTMFPDTGDTAAIPTRIELATMDPGDQYGARGNERIVLIPAKGGPFAIILPGPDTSPNAPAGERWITHRNAAGVVDSYVKHTNDGPTPGDGLGAHLSNGGALHRASTSGGRSIVQNDTAKTITVSGAGGTPHTRVVDDNEATLGIKDTTAGGLVAHLDDVLQQIKHQAAASVYTIVDGNGNAISHVVGAGGVIGLGAAASSLTADQAALNKTHLTSYDGNLQTAKLADYVKYANLLNTVGAITSGQLADMLAALVAGWTNGTTIPAGSSIVRMVT